MDPHPVQIIKLDVKTDGLEMDIDALADILLNEKCRERPLCVVSIAGDFRKGKSFMLNFFLRYLYHISEKQDKEFEEGKKDDEDTGDWLGGPNQELKGFSWRGGDDPETTGILVWSEPIVITRPDGQEVAVLLIDTQGAFDSRQSTNQTAIIFALSTLTSSLQIFNMFNNIQEDNLLNLDTFLGYGQMALDKSQETPFQELCFLVRDWRSPQTHPYGAEGGASLLAKKMKLCDDVPEAVNNRRKRLEKCFERKTCFLMPHPGLNVTVDRWGDRRGQISDMEPEFVENLREFVPMVLSPENLLIKRAGGEVVNGQSLLEYFKVYAETFRSGDMPEAKELYEALAEASNLAAVTNSKNDYIKSMEDVCGGSKPYVNPKILEQKHNQLLKEAMRNFQDKKKMGEEEYCQTFAKKLNEELLNNYEKFVEQNNAKNMFNMWGSPLILLCLWFLAFTLSRIFEIIGIGPLANLFYLQATICFISIIAYLSLKYTGNFPEIVVAVDKVAEFCWVKAMDTAIGQITQRVHQQHS